MRIPLLFVAMLASSLACDPAPEKPADKPADAKPADAKTPDNRGVWSEEAKSNVTGDRRGHADCTRECDTKTLSETDRATCRLNCNTAFKISDSPARAEDPNLRAAANCFGTCNEGDKANLDTCAAACVTAATAVAAPTVQALQTCVGECYSDPATQATDHETCKLRCLQVAARAAPAPAAAPTAAPAAPATAPTAAPQ